MKYTLVLALALPSAVLAFVGDPDHFDHFTGCKFCECFVKYKDCDLWIPDRPYKVATRPYGVSEDDCIAECLRDNICTAATFGIVGGLHWFSCEFYSEPIVPMTGLSYTPHISVYVKRVSMPCMLDFSDAKRIDVTEAKDLIDAVVARKTKTARLANRRNPLAG